jgi:hypothetical protein
MKKDRRLIDIAEKPRTNNKGGARRPQIYTLPPVGILPMR